MQSMHNMFHGVREYLNPILKDSKFKEEGVLTPEEFIAAGDYLVFKFPTWSWESGEESKRRDYLPPNKQFLITRNVPCLRRANQMAHDDDKFEDNEELDGEDGWVAAFQGAEGQKAINKIIVDIEDEEEIATDEINNKLSGLHLNNEQDLKEDDDKIPSDLDDIPDIDDEEEEEDQATLKTIIPQVQESKEENKENNTSNLLLTRTYDLSITYDKYYRTPRIWLYGYDEIRKPLNPDQVLEDISQDHANKTVTIDPHPHLPIVLASIHPCKHSSVMKRLIGYSSEAGKEVRVDQYMILFLKFISCVLPTIDYDHTASAE